MELLPFSPTLGGKPLKRWKMEIWRRDKGQRYYYPGYNMAERILFLFFFVFFISCHLNLFYLLHFVDSVSCFSRYPRFCPGVWRHEARRHVCINGMTTCHSGQVSQKLLLHAYVPSVLHSCPQAFKRRAIKKHRQLLLPRVWFPITQITRVCGRVYCPHVQLNSDGLYTSRLHEQIRDLAEHDSSLVRFQLSTLSSQEIIDGMPVAEPLIGKK